VRFRHLLILVTAATAVALPSDLSAEASAKAGADLTIVRTFTGWRDAASFKRISEYFDGKENTGKETVLRTHPDQRAGYYFLVRLANPGAAQKVRFQLQLFEQGTSASRTVVFPAELKSGSGVFQLGLTGPEWQDAKSQPVAWHLQVLADDGRVLASEKSYLWEKPAGK
jgi:hypothetical protein